MSDFSKIGIHYGVKAKEYFSLPYASNSELKAFAKNPHKWKNSKPFEATASMKHGSLVDCLLLTPECFGTDYILSPFESFRTKEARDWKAEQAENGTEIVTSADYSKAVMAVEALRANKAAQDVIDQSNKQVVVVFDTEDNKGRVTRCKAMIDLVSTRYGIITDLKTAADASPEGFGKALSNFGYAHQAAWYLDGYNSASEEKADREKFNFLVSENSEPYEVATYQLDQDAIEYGRRQYLRNLTLWNDCKESGEYPSYTNGWTTIDLPAWTYKSEEN